MDFTFWEDSEDCSLPGWGNRLPILSGKITSVTTKSMGKITQKNQVNFDCRSTGQVKCPH